VREGPADAAVVGARGAEHTLNRSAVSKHLSPEIEDGAAKKECPTKCCGRAEPGIQERGMLSEEQPLEGVEPDEKQMQMGELWSFTVETGHHLYFQAAGLCESWRPGP
jgi:hypothetical protein